ncbi:hypothetical protein KUCAC02_029895, partial [Chaenocephalus aceratus]
LWIGSAPPKCVGALFLSRPLFLPLPLSPLPPPATIAEREGLHTLCMANSSGEGGGETRTAL